MNDHLEQFAPSTQWIWASPGELGAWWMFRKAFSVAKVQKAELNMTANFYYIVYINGSIVARGP
ncbi:hypothetical protein EHS13_31605 [Paenibacillus psychroresistens]|uniref:Uncharacterized protein n=1 Tax=Paenibacillus psychroresistens TaxID=1778678 RepID=A0A6B8RUI0_9BACL|nr:hypothetical protein [Paenibacillus psychroresistens]QGQ99103.1 hypothetical protein EHS13_31605 [Paenibacillus psychroresistens]